MNRETATAVNPLPASRSVNGHGNQAVALDGHIRREQPQARQTSTLLKTAWRGWLKFAEVLGTIQMMVILSLVYWIMLPIIAIPLKLFSDPLMLRNLGQARWIKRDSGSPTLDEMKQQY